MIARVRTARVRTARVRTAAPGLPAGSPGRGCGRGRSGGAAAGYAYRATRPARASQQTLEHAQAGVLPPAPFHGPHQAGILPQPRPQTAVISFNVTADGRAELTDLFRTITARARFLTAGGTPPPTRHRRAAVRLGRARPGRGPATA